MTGESSILMCVVRFGRCCVAGALLATAGCSSRPSAIPPAKVNINGVVADLMAAHDTDKNGGAIAQRIVGIAAVGRVFRSVPSQRDR